MPPELLGRYEIIEELGRGAMGVVYKARDPLIDRTVAIKAVCLDLSGEESAAFEQRFYREAKSAGRLNHSNIVTIHDVGKSDSFAYIAMEFLKGQSLREILDSGVVLPPERIAEIVAQVADGLGFAHENGIVHRDIKPPNIMVLDNGVVKITDFGIALLPTGSRTLAGTVFGSPKYMAPERLAGNKVDGRADLFSLGAVLYEMLTGFTPFFGGDLDTLFDQIINVMPTAPSSRNKGIAPAFDYIVAKAMAKHPEDRYSCAQAMATDLRNFRDLQPPSGLPFKLRALELRTTRRQFVQAAEFPHAEAAPDGASFGTVAADDIASRQRRRLIVYGMPAALVAALVGGAGLSMYESTATQPAANQVDGNDSAEKLSVSNPVKTTLPSDESVPVEREATRAPAASSEPARPVIRQMLAVEKPMARLALAVTPWGEVYVDGRKKGVSPPLTEIRLVPGKHTIEIRNTTFPSYVQFVALESDARLKIKHKF